jgi:hypothetical protein
MSMTTRNFLLVLILFGAIQVGCQSNKPSKDETSSSLKNADSSKVDKMGNSQDSPDDYTEGTVDYDQTVYPFDFENKSILIVPNAEFHSDGRDQIEAKKNGWVYLKRSPVFTLRTLKQT